MWRVYNRANTSRHLAPGGAPPRKGFAIVVALVLMAFVMLLLVNLGVMVSLETREATSTQQLNLAKENALLGLQTAIGQLQRTAGPDARVTATATLLDNDPGTGEIEGVSNPHWTGVWRRDLNHEELPLPGPTVAAGHDAHPDQLLTWLVSGNTLSTPLHVVPDSPLSIQVAPSNIVTLVDNAVENDADKVSVAKVSIEHDGATIGHYAYWVGDEGVKMKIDIQDDRLTELAPVDHREATGLWVGSSPGVAELEDFEGFSESSLARLQDLRNLPLVNPAASSAVLGHRYFHDFTTRSLGLLTSNRTYDYDPATAGPNNRRPGGLKRDLSLAFEMSDTDFNSDALFAGAGRNELGHGWPVSRPEGGNYYLDYSELFSHNFVYTVRAPSDSPGQSVFGPTWQSLRNYHNLYKSVDPAADLPVIHANAVPVVLSATDNPDLDGRSLADFYIDNGGHTNDDARTDDPSNFWGSNDYLRPTNVRLTPIVTNIVYVLSVYGTDEVVSAGQTPRTQLGIVIDIYVSLWNPYNVALRFDAIQVRNSVPNLRVTFSSPFLQIEESKNDEFGSEVRTLLPDETYADDLQNIVNVAAESSDALSSASIFAYLLDDLGNKASDQLLMPGEVRVYYGDNAYNYRELPLSALASDFPATATSGMAYHNFRKDDINYRLFLEQNLPPELSNVDVAFLSPDVQHAEINNMRMELNYSLGQYKTHLGGYANAYYWQSFFKTSNQHFRLDASNTGHTGQIGSTNLSEEEVANLKQPIGKVVLTLSNEGTDDDDDRARFLVDSNPRAIRYRPYSGDSRGVSGPSLISAYDIKATPVSATAVTMTGEIGAFEGPNGTYRGNWGEGTANRNDELSSLAMFSVPVRPMLSLGELQHCLIDDWQHSPAYPTANSYASAYVDSRLVVDGSDGFEPGASFQTQVDHSWLMNHHLFDDFYFSGLGAVTGNEQAALVDSLITTGSLAERNPRLVLFRPDDISDADLTDVFLPAIMPNASEDRPYAQAAAYLAVDGAFNVNSTSVDAWRTLLMSVKDPDVPVFDPDSGSLGFEQMDDFPFPRTLPAKGEADYAWNSTVSLNRDQVADLAEEIVTEIKTRGPFLSLADFVNRRLEGAGDPTSQRGTLQAAIDRSGINSYFDVEAGEDDYEHPENITTMASAGAPGYLLQGDVLQAIAPVLTARSDTFTIRFYGDVTNPLTDQVEAQAWGEAVVQRIALKVDPAESIVEGDEEGGLGRQFRVVSFRWLDEGEV